MTESCKPKRLKFRPLPPYERVRELFHYDPLTGVLIRKISTSNSVKVGDVVGCISSNGYWVGNVDGKVYLLHRIIWLWMTGDDPGEMEVDHENTQEEDNRWGNLRLATSTQNSGNTGLGRRNISGFKGVTWHKECKKWFAKITKGGRQEYLGVFVNIEDAGAAYAKRAQELFGEFARAN